VLDIIEALTILVIPLQPIASLTNFIENLIN
jgi:hypothetical protein